MESVRLRSFQCSIGCNTVSVAQPEGALGQILRPAVTLSLRRNVFVAVELEGEGGEEGPEN